MNIEFDPAKNARNIAERNLSFTAVAYFKWNTAHIVEDVRKVYPERRFIAFGFLAVRLHILCFTPLDDGGVRVISFRKANKRERRKYEQATID